MKSILPLILCVLLFNACKKEPIEKSNTSDYLVFGHFYGECMGEGCVEIFKLTNTTLLEDTNDHYPGSQNAYNGNFSVDRSTFFSQVEDLWEVIPDNIFEETETVIGQPDAGDWGGLYFEIQKENFHRYWLIDQQKSGIPEYLYELTDSINAKISVLIQTEYQN